MLVEEQTKAYTLEEAFAYCRHLAHTHYENFTVVSWFLPRPLRPYMYSLYAYCRGVDDLGDEAAGDHLALLDQWEGELRRCYSGTPHHPTFIALQQTIQRFHIPPQPFLNLIEANRMDQRTNRFPTYADLLYYCQHSANPVGHLVLHLFGYSDPERHRLADATCTALQLANFWQDVVVDLGKGRIYIPLEDFATFGYTEAELQAQIYNDNFRQLMAFQVSRARQLFAQGLPLVRLVDGRLKLDLKLFSLGGLAILDAIEAIGYNVLRVRPSLSRAKKAWLVVRACLPVRQGLLPLPIHVKGMS